MGSVDLLLCVMAVRVGQSHSQVLSDTPVLCRGTGNETEARCTVE